MANELSPPRELRLVLPLAPSLNHAYPGKARRRLSAEGQAFKAAAQEMVQLAALATGWRYPPRARLAVGMRLWFESASSSAQSDIDNRFKLAGDALAAGLGYNDHCVDRILLERAGVDPAAPRAEVTVVILRGGG